MIAKTFLFILIFINLHADFALEETYYVKTDEVNLSSIISYVKNDSNLFTIEKNRYSKRVKTKDLIEILKKHGFSNYKSKSSYTNFIIKSPIDTSKIENSIKEYYQNRYEQIEIQNIKVEPRGYITSLPKEYKVDIGNREYLQRSATVNIKTPDNKRVFFDYDISAKIYVYVSKNKIKKDVEISNINSVKKSITLDRLRAKPIQNIEAGSIQSKHYISKDTILTIRDVEPLSVVKRDSLININMHANNMAITFSAKALQDGKVNDIIKVQKSNGTILKVKVIGHNQAEIR